MSFVQGTGALVVWIVHVLRAFMALHARRTVAAILVSMLQKIATILAFLLPLKVILLAGTPGVPRYFAFFVDPAYREHWIVGLAAGAIVFYAMSLLLERRLSRLARAVGEDLFTNGAAYHQRADQKEHVAAQFERVASATGGMIFALLGILALLVLNPWLAAVVVGLVLFEYTFTSALFTAAVERLVDAASFIAERGLSYLSVLSSINFLIGFLVILVPFVLGEDGNVLFALIAFVILRQVLSGLAGAIGNYVRIYGEREEMRYLSPAQSDVRAPAEDRAEARLRRAVARDARTAQVLALLRKTDRGIVSARVDWQDPCAKGQLQFRVEGEGADGNVRFRGTLSVFTNRARHEPQNELLLRRSTGSAFPGLPPLVGTVDLKGLDAVLHRFDSQAQISASDWREMDIQLLTAAWAVAPPEEIVSAYFKTHPSFESRLDEDLLRKLSLGANSAEDEEALEAFGARLEAIRAEIAKVPLYVHHTFRSSRAGALDDAGNPLFRRPGAWAVRPIGFYVPRVLRKANLRAAVDAVRDARAEDAGRLTPERVRLVGVCAAVFDAVTKERLRAAIALLPKTASTLMTFE